MENRLRICMIAFMFAPLVGGSEVQAEKQARHLMSLGHEVTVVTLHYDKKWKKTEVLDGLPVVRVGGLYSPQGILRIGRFGHVPIDILMFLTLWRLRNRFDVYHSLQLSPLAAVATIIGKLTRKPVIINIPSAGPGKKQQAEDATLMADTLTDTEFLKIPFKDIVVGDIGYLYKSAVGGKAIIKFLQKSDAFYQVLSSRSVPYMTSHGFRKEKIALIPNGVDTDKFCPQPDARPNPEQPERDILCVARLQYPKGVDVLLHAWSRMMREPDAWRSHLKPRLLVAGEGPLQPQLERIATELGIQDSVKFLGLQRNVIPLLQHAWGFVMPSRWEGMPNALLEAMSIGLPSIATRVSGSEDIVSDGINGLLVEPEQPAELAVALRRIIEDTDFAHHIGQEARATIVRDYQLNHVMEQCLDLYQSVLSPEKKPLPLAPKGAEK